MRRGAALLALAALVLAGPAMGEVRPEDVPEELHEQYGFISVDMPGDFGDGPPGGRSSWPELVGRPKDAARDALLAEAPNLKVFLVREGSMVTMDYRMDRVRVMFDPETGLVTQEPRIG